MNYVYHGSNVKNLEFIKPHKSTHLNEWVYATYSMAIATIFLSPLHSDYYYYLSGNGITSDVVLVERKEGMFKKIFNYDGYIYKLNGDNFKSGKTGWSAEVVSDKEEKVVSSYYVKNIFDELIEINKKGLIKLYLYPNRPDFVPQDNSDLIPKVVRWYKCGFNIDKFYELYPELKDDFLRIINE